MLLVVMDTVYVCANVMGDGDAMECEMLKMVVL